MNETIDRYLDRLIATGLFGRTRDAVRDQLVREGIRRLISERLLTLDSAAGASARKDEGASGKASAEGPTAEPQIVPTPTAETLSPTQAAVLNEMRFIEDWHAGVDLGVLTKRYGLQFSEIDKLIQRLDIVRSPQRRAAIARMMAGAKANKRPAAGVASREGAKPGSDDVLPADCKPTVAPPPGLTPPAAGTDVTGRRNGNAFWTAERNAEFAEMWHRGDEVTDIVRHFEEKYGKKFSPGSIPNRATDMGIGSSAERNRARKEKNARHGGSALVRNLVDGTSKSGPMKIRDDDLREPPVLLATGRQAAENAGKPNPVSHVIAGNAKTARGWPEERRAILTKLWKAGNTYAEIALDMDLKPAEVIAAVAQLGLTNDADRRKAMHG